MITSISTSATGNATGKANLKVLLFQLLSYLLEHYLILTQNNYYSLDWTICFFHTIFKQVSSKALDNCKASNLGTSW